MRDGSWVLGLFINLPWARHELGRSPGRLGCWRMNGVEGSIWEFGRDGSRRAPKVGPAAILNRWGDGPA